MLSFITTNLLWTAGSSIVLVLVGVAVAGILFWRPLLPTALALFAFPFYFFRNPERICSEALLDNTVLVCPSDGRVVSVESLSVDAPERNKGYTQKVAIFLSIFDVHITRLPLAGTVADISYRPGKFLMAFAPKSSEINERNEVIVTDEQGRSLLTRQIAGFIARRICWWVDKGESVAVGQRFGMIRFGSRVEVFAPDDVSWSVKSGEYVYGGRTVLGRWN